MNSIETESSVSFVLYSGTRLPKSHYVYAIETRSLVKNKKKKKFLNVVGLF